MHAESILCFLYCARCPDVLCSVVLWSRKYRMCRHQCHSGTEFLHPSQRDTGGRNWVLLTWWQQDKAELTLRCETWGTHWNWAPCNVDYISSKSELCWRDEHNSSKIYSLMWCVDGGKCILLITHNMFILIMACMEASTWSYFSLSNLFVCIWT